MLAEIQQAILNQFQAQGLDVKNFDVRRDPSGVLVMPAAVCHIEQGAFTKVSNIVFRADVKVYIDLVFQYMGHDETDRRKGLYPIFEAALGMLMFQTLDLDIHPLEPFSFQNVTTHEDATRGAIIFRLIFKTSYEISKTEYAKTSDLLKVLLTEYLKPGDTTTVQAQIPIT